MAFKWPKWIPRELFTGMRLRVVVLIAALTAALIILLSFVVEAIFEQNLINQKKIQGRIALTAMQTNVDVVYAAQGAARTTGPTMSGLVQGMILNMEFSTLVFVDREQNVIGHSKSEMIGMVLADEDLRKAMEERKLIYRVIGSDTGNPEMIFSGPIYREGTVIGAARFGLPLGDMVITLYNTKRILFLYAALDALLMILFGSLILMRVLVRPIEEMLTATERMAGGDYRIILPHTTAGELDRLAKALGRLASTLRDKEAVGKRQLTRLERANKELKEAHDQLMHSDRLAYVGRVAAGMAHEVGNPLGAIFGYLEILREAELTAEDAEVVERITAEIKRIDKTMRELLDFSRIKPARSEPTDLPALAAETVTLMKSQRGLDRVQVEVLPAPNLPPVRLDPDQFKQMILNLLLNAADAMHDEGAITISAEARPFDRMELFEEQLPGAPSEKEVPFTDCLRRGIVLSDRIGPVEGTPMVWLHITDSGPGMPTEVLQNVLEPFYTTKPKGKGTGLGLAICLRIVSSTGGLMRIESRPGVGTRVSLVYPVDTKEENHGE
ncbi:MAG TPA: ATP-binding protein [bacterium]|nr:ATP-binding protein [bacterium]